MDTMSRRSNYKNIAFAVMVTTLLLSIASLFLLGRTEAGLGTVPQPQRLFISGTYTTAEDNAPRPLPVDGDFGYPNGEIATTVTGHFDREVPAGEIISFRLDNLHLRLFLDGELVCEYGAPYSVLPNARSAGNDWQYFTSPGISAEQEVRLELKNHYNNHTNTVYKTFFGQLYTGNPAVHISQNLRGAVPQGLMAIFILIMGILELGYALALALAKADANEYFTLAGLSITCGVWFFIDFDTLALVSPYPVFNNALQHLALSMALCYVLMYTATQLTAWRKACVRVAGWAAILMTLAAILCQHLGPMDYYDLTLPLYLLMGGSALLMLAMLPLEAHTRQGTGAWHRLWPLALLLLGALADVVLGYLGAATFLLFEATFCLFTCCQIYFALRAVTGSAEDKVRIRLLQEDRERQQRTLEYEMLISRSTKGLYESIYELDITHNCAGGEGTRKYFESLGIPGDTPYDQALERIVQMQIHPDYRQGYMEIFSPKAALKQYSQGVDALQYDFLITQDGENYYWMRIDARIFFWKDDRSVRMITYRQNVDSEKRQELELLSRADQDSLTGLLNREALERQARSLLAEKKLSCGMGCIILDIDDFKTVNDTFGHMAGDFVLSQLSVLLCAECSPRDIMGRLGGDEFVVMAPCSGIEEIEGRLAHLMSALATAHTQFEGRLLPLSVSAGVAYLSCGTATFEAMYKRSDEALYQSKKKGKRCYTILEMEGQE